MLIASPPSPKQLSSPVSSLGHVYSHCHFSLRTVDNGMVLSQVGTVNQALGDRRQRIELNPGKVYSRKRENRFITRYYTPQNMGNRPTPSRDWPQGLEGFYSYRADISGLVLVGFYCACTSSYITLKLLFMWSPMIFLDWPPGKRVSQC